MDEELIQRSVQFPKSLFTELSQISKNKGISFAAIVREACIEYLDKSTPGLCPSCHTQNLPDSQYCQKCGSSLLSGVSEQSIQYQVDEVKERLRKLEEEKEMMFKRYLEKMKKECERN